VEHYVLLELGCAEAFAYEAQDVACDWQEDAALAEARVQAHAQRQEHFPELLVCKGCQVLVCVKCEVLDQERGDKAGRQGVDAERHSSRERVSNFLLHAADHESKSVSLLHACAILQFKHVLE